LAGEGRCASAADTIYRNSQLPGEFSICPCLSLSSGDVAIAAEPEPSAAAATLQRLVAGVTVRRTANGGLLIEAPPDAAATLGALFSGMAQLLQAAAAPQATDEGPVGRR
jgi:hypothetical protein